MGTSLRVGSLALLALTISLGGAAVAVSGTSSTGRSQARILETMRLDTSTKQRGIFVGPVVSRHKLAKGLYYVAIVKGTFAYKRLRGTYCGQRERLPMRRSPGRYNGRVNMDVEFIFAEKPRRGPARACRSTGATSRSQPGCPTAISSRSADRRPARLPPTATVICSRAAAIRRSSASATGSPRTTTALSRSSCAARHEQRSRHDRSDPEARRMRDELHSLVRDPGPSMRHVAVAHGLEYGRDTAWWRCVLSCNPRARAPAGTGGDHRPVGCAAALEGASGFAGRAQVPFTCCGAPLP